MKISFHINDSDLGKHEVVMDLVRDAIVGELFLRAKQEIEALYDDGLISTSEYGQKLAIAYADALDIICQWNPD